MAIMSCKLETIDVTNYSEAAGSERKKVAISDPTSTPSIATDLCQKHRRSA
jgi:hypothetical protein